MQVGHAVAAVSGVNVIGSRLAVEQGLLLLQYPEMCFAILQGCFVSLEAVPT